jgi:hypothetical protein
MTLEACQQQHIFAERGGQGEEAIVLGIGHRIVPVTNYSGWKTSQA